MLFGHHHDTDDLGMLMVAVCTWVSSAVMHRNGVLAECMMRCEPTGLLSMPMVTL